MYDATIYRNVAREVLRWAVKGTSSAEVERYLRKLPDNYTEECTKITKVYVEAMLYSYPDYIETVWKVTQYVLPQYVCARLEDDDITSEVIEKLISKYHIDIH